MPTMPLYYTLTDGAGNIILSQFTQDPAAPISGTQRLVKDQTPDYDSETQYIVRITPVPPGQDHVEYQVSDITYTDDQLAGSAIEKRNVRLSKSDWTQLPDVQLTETQITAWRLYRQELRDITGQAGYPRTINWPVQPE